MNIDEEQPPVTDYRLSPYDLPVVGWLVRNPHREDAARLYARARKMPWWRPGLVLDRRTLGCRYAAFRGQL